MPTKFTIKSGDTLVGIAEQFLNDPRAFIDIVRANPGLFRTLADGTLDLTLQPGQSIIIPSARPEGAPTPFIPFGSSFGVSGADGFTKTTLATKPGGQAITETFASAADVTSGVVGAEITETGAAFLEQTLASTAAEDLERRAVTQTSVDPSLFKRNLIPETPGLERGGTFGTAPVVTPQATSSTLPDIGLANPLGTGVLVKPPVFSIGTQPFAGPSTAEAPPEQGALSGIPEGFFDPEQSAINRAANEAVEIGGIGREAGMGEEQINRLINAPPPGFSLETLRTSIRVLEEISAGNILPTISSLVAKTLGLEPFLMTAGYIETSAGWVRDPALSEPAPSVSSATSAPTSFGGGGFGVSFGGGFGGGGVRGSSQAFKSPTIRWRIGFA